MIVLDRRLNFWDVVVQIIAIIVFFRFIFNAIADKDIDQLAYAVLTFIILIAYVKIAQFQGRL